MRKLAIAAMAAAAIGVFSASAGASESGIKIGVLSCGMESSVGMIIASSKRVDCVYQPSGGGRVEHYDGRISKIGIDVVVTNQTVLVWGVFAPGKVKRGALEGTYVGASAEATLAVGLGANVLIGGFKRSISLQPVSLQMQTGINIAAGAAGLHLDYRRR
jgi:uncharacterized protein DUF992